MLNFDLMDTVAGRQIYKEGMLDSTREMLADILRAKPAKKLKNLKDGKGRLYINKTQYFDGIPETVWNFYIGGYQVCHKWLSDRKKAGRRLSDDDIRHYHKIVVALNETLRIMQEIDQVLDAHGGFPIQ